MCVFEAFLWHYDLDVLQITPVWCCTKGGFFVRKSPFYRFINNFVSFFLCVHLNLFNFVNASEL